MVASSFDLISDLHADVWLQQYDYAKQVSVDVFVDALVPANPSKFLVIAGDLGDLNSQNELLLHSFKHHYKYILLVMGNHELHLINEFEKELYGDSMIRLKAMKEKAERIEGVTYLDGSIVIADGIKFGGAGMWHDFSYGISLGYSKSFLYDLWLKNMKKSDSDLIFPRFSHDSLEAFFQAELRELEAVTDECQVIVTHVGPNAASMPCKYKESPVSTFFYFDGDHLLNRAGSKVWCYGHSHAHSDYVHSSGCRLINNALGTPRDRTGAKIRTVHL
ncbi:hypothetical protein BSK65_10695 [Paenibacillus odorifer]|uniref:Calcineurin-like phosphoesterase domain-containing protein n=1 Tax=Paenibacillus odorifer TaxID=189426 RepID=A0A1R0ZJY0_9BACL|nr:metallophosphoesterase [Paenibacillus odorifer]OME71500.1 hypothetical protein BSK65_10695 [Paenibacillus odorifer]